MNTLKNNPMPATSTYGNKNESDKKDIRGPEAKADDYVDKIKMSIRIHERNGGGRSSFIGNEGRDDTKRTDDYPSVCPTGPRSSAPMTIRRKGCG